MIDKIAAKMWVLCAFSPVWGWIPVVDEVRSERAHASWGGSLRCDVTVRCGDSRKEAKKKLPSSVCASHWDSFRANR